MYFMITLMHVSLQQSNVMQMLDVQPKKGVVSQRRSAVLTLSHELFLLKRIWNAPKLYYQVEKLRVYHNSVWAWYSVRNLSSKGKYVVPFDRKLAVTGMKLWDRNNQIWQIGRFKGLVNYARPDTFVYLPPHGIVRFRSIVSSGDGKPLQMKKIPPNNQTRRPRKLAYLIIGWSETYSKLDEGKNESIPVYEIGLGDVAVEWANGNPPRSWRHTIRLYGDEE